MDTINTRILIVNDDLSALQILVASLNEQGFIAIPATTGEEALRLLVAAPDSFGLVLLDRQMIESDCLTLLRRMKAEKILCNIPVVMQT